MFGIVGGEEAIQENLREQHPWYVSCLAMGKRINTEVLNEAKTTNMVCQV